MKISSFYWTPERIDHIARHGVKPEEVEEAAFDDRHHIVQRLKRATAYPERMIYRLLGQAQSGRYLTVIFLPKGRGRAYVVTARDMTPAGGTILREEVKLPESVEELAAFFDRTDTQEMEWEDAEEVEFKRPELVSVSVRLPKDDLLAIRKAAAKLGIGYTTYIRMVLRKAANDYRTTRG